MSDVVKQEVPPKHLARADLVEGDWLAAQRVPPAAWMRPHPPVRRRARLARRLLEVVVQVLAAPPEMAVPVRVLHQTHAQACQTAPYLDVLH